MNKHSKKRLGYGLAAFAMAATPALSGASVFAATSRVALDAGKNSEFVCDNNYVFGEAQKDATVVLKEATAGCTIYVETTGVTLDLGGNTIDSTVKNATIEIAKDAGLTLKNGTVQNKMASHPVVFNNGNFVLDGATLTKGGVNYYNLLNHGNAIVKSGTIINNDTKASLVDNGYANYGGSSRYTGYKAGTGIANPTLVIEDGLFDGGMNTIKNDDGGILTVNGGKFQNNYQIAVMNWHRATINGGTFEVPTGNDKTTVFVGHYDTGVNDGYLEVNGGVFKAEYFIESMFDSSKVYENVEVIIKDGDFTNITKSIINLDTPTERPNIAEKMTITGGKFKAAAEKASEGSEEGVAEETDSNNEAAAGIVSENLSGILSGEYKGFKLDEGANLSDLLTKEISAEVTTTAYDESTTDQEKIDEYDVMDNRLVDEQDALKDDELVIRYSTFDINVAVLAGGNKIGSLTEVPTALQFNLDLPEEMKNDIKEAVENGYEATVKVYRAHTDNEGVSVEELASVDGEGLDTIGFESDKFSTYALAAIYTLPEETPAEEEEAANTEDMETPEVPDTGFFKYAAKQQASMLTAAQEKNYAPYIAAAIFAFAIYGFLMKRLVLNVRDEE